MEQVISPYLLYLAVVVGGAGVCLALPRGRPRPQIIGALLAAAGFGLVLVGLGVSGVRSGEGLPNLYFYVFAFVALASALRMITHPKPVYAALYFIMTVLASAGVFLILSAEFMAFALVIVYAGAILITYLFVIMLATQAPTEEQVEFLAEYDTTSREPVAATVAAFLLLGVLTTMFFTGSTHLPAPVDSVAAEGRLAELPGKVERILLRDGIIAEGEHVVERDGMPMIDLDAGQVVVAGADGSPRVISREHWPADMELSNVEGIGFNLLNDHPGTIEIAGVILLMAMLGAVVLARRQMQIDEDEKAAAAREGTP